MDSPIPTRRSTVVLLCGVAGAGTTTVARALERAGYERLSIDEEMWARSGLVYLKQDP